MLMNTTPDNPCQSVYQSIKEFPLNLKKSCQSFTKQQKKTNAYQNERMKQMQQKILETKKR